MELRHLSRGMTGGRRVGATFEDVTRLAASLPEAEQSTSYGTPALKVRGKSFCRMWGAREHKRDRVEDTEVLVVFCDLAWKETVIDNSGGVLFSTPHYDGYPAMLIHLADVTHDDLAAYLEESYMRRAPTSLRRLVECNNEAVAHRPEDG